MTALAEGMICLFIAIGVWFVLGMVCDYVERNRSINYALRDD